METSVLEKIKDIDFKPIFDKKGYAWFSKGLYNLNIIGIRANTDNKVTNQYDDVLVLDYINEKGRARNMYAITTEPGIDFMLSPMSSNGTAILVPGQYRGCWEIGKHQGKYKALVQRKPVSVYRDDNNDDIYDLNPNKIQNGTFGINIHRASEYKTSVKIDKYSAGCQVFANPSEFKSFMTICEKQRDTYGNTFTYTLLDEKELFL